MSHDINGTWTWRVWIASHLDVYLMILTKTERGIAALADADIQKLVLRQRLEKSEDLECQCQSEPKAKALAAYYVGKTLI